MHYYGFIPENNNYISVPIKLVFDKNDPLLDIKQKILGINTLEIRSLPFFPDLDYLGSQNEKVMSYLRLISFEGNSSALMQVI